MVAAKRIGILTSGGDCAGLNAVIRAVVTHAVDSYGWEVIGILNGTAGLLERPVACLALDPAMVPAAIQRQGGTFLGTTNRGDPFAYPMADGSLADRSGEVIEGLNAIDLDALIGIGGDGSLRILRRLALQGGFNFVGIPKTIDNDIGATEIAIGHATAVDVATEALDRLQPTAASHSRVMVLEVMGRDAGHIALASGIAGGADVILIPELKYRLAGIAAKIHAIKAAGRNFALVVVAEATPAESGEAITTVQAGGIETYGGIGHHIGAAIARLTGAETRVSVLGHVQRGGQPDARDRLMAAVMGVRAVDLIAEERYDRMVAWQNRAAVDVPLADAIAETRAVDPAGALVATARALGIYVGERG